MGYNLVVTELVFLPSLLQCLASCFKGFCPLTLELTMPWHLSRAPERRTHTTIILDSRRTQCLNSKRQKSTTLYRSPQRARIVKEEQERALDSVLVVCVGCPPNGLTKMISQNNPRPEGVGMIKFSNTAAPTYEHAQTPGTPNSGPQSLSGVDYGSLR